MLGKILIYFKQRHRLPLVSFLCLLAIYASAQVVLSRQVSFVPKVPQVAQSPRIQPQAQPKGKPFELVYSSRVLKRQGFDPQIFLDSVKFYHDGAYLYCDSAYYDEKQNTFEAFSNVRMEQGDTVFLYGKYMHYDGNTKIVKFRENVRLEHDPREVTLFTDSLNFHRKMNSGYYFNGGMLVDTVNELTSDWGQYEINYNMATFKRKVKLNNPRFTLTTEELRYDTNAKKAIFTELTVIESDSGTIRTSNGWYNTVTEEAFLTKRSKIVNKEGNQTLIGDSIHRRKAEGIMEVFGNMFLEDTIKRVILIGDYGFYNELTDYAMATKNPYCIEYSQKDSLFIAADTLKLITIFDTLKIKDTLLPPKELLSEADSVQIDEDTLLAKLTPLPLNPKATKPSNKNIYRQIKAYHGVRFYRPDMQGVCDSMLFNTKDSILYLYKDPILWNDKNQLLGDTIEIFMNDSTIDFVHVKKYSFSIEQKDSLLFNQIKGNSMKAYFENKKVKRVLIEGSAESIFYPEEKGGEVTGLNLLTSSYMDIHLNNSKLEKLIAWPKPVGKMTPLFLIEPAQRRLKDFYWYDYLRPINKDDIFRKVEKKSTDIKPKRSAVFDREE